MIMKTRTFKRGMQQWFPGLSAYSLVDHNEFFHDVNGGLYNANEIEGTSLQWYASTKLSNFIYTTILQQ